MSNTIDFGALQRVNRANPGSTKSVDYRLKWSPEKSEFMFSQELFNELDLASNSLTQYNTPTSVVLAVEPGNEGQFFNKKKERNKGRRFKNIELTNALKNVGISATKLDLERAKTPEGEDAVMGTCPLYVVVEANDEEADVQLAETEAPQTDVPQDEIEY